MSGHADIRGDGSFPDPAFFADDRNNLSVRCHCVSSSRCGQQYISHCRILYSCTTQAVNSARCFYPLSFRLLRSRRVPTGVSGSELDRAGCRGSGFSWSVYRCVQYINVHNVTAVLWRDFARPGRRAVSRKGQGRPAPRQSNRSSRVPGVGPIPPVEIENPIGRRRKHGHDGYPHHTRCSLRRRDRSRPA
jgi:hypothetical protein